MKKYSFSGLLTILYLCSFSQTPYFPDYSSYKANKLSSYESDNNYKSYLKNGSHDVVISKGEFEEFCELTAYTKKSMINTGQVYQNLDGCEAYLQKLVDRIISANDIDFDCKVVLLRNHGANAFAMHGEELFVQIGLLAAVENESQLAFVLAHELSHLINFDPLKGFARATDLRSRRFRRKALGVLINNANYSRNQERAADSFAVYAIKNAKLIDKNVSNLFSYVISVDSIYQSVNIERSLSYVESNIPDSTKPLEKLLRSHPESFKRTNFIDSIIKGELKTKEKLYSSKGFNKARKLAQYELLHLVMIGSEYHKCIDKAFRFHLVDQADPTFIYYMMEALRRQVYVDDEFAAELFLDKIYADYLPEDASIFQYPNLLIQDDSILNAVSSHRFFTRPLIGSIPQQITNDSMFAIMANLANKLGIVEAAFSEALYDYVNGSKNKLKAYAITNNGRFKALSKAILNEKQYDQKNKTQLVLVNDMNYIEEKSYGYRLHLKKSESSSANFNEYLLDFGRDNLSEFSIEPLPKVVDNEYGKLIELYDGLKILKSIYSEFDMDLLEEKGPSDEVVFEYEEDEDEDEDKFDLFVLSPELWLLFNKYDLKSIDIVSSISLDSRSNSEWIWKVIYPPSIYYNIMMGSSINSYWFTKTKISPFNRKSPITYAESEVNYKVNKYFYTNTLYYLMLE